MKTLIDQLGFAHTFNAVPNRIVSLVPSQTELLFEMGLEQKIVGITKYCVHPLHFKATKTSVGGTKKVHFQKIKNLEPDIIICNKEENTPEMVDELRKICTVWLTDIADLKANKTMISDFGAIFNCRTEAQKINDKIEFATLDFEQFMSNIKPQKAAYFIWKNPYMAAGGATYIDAMLQLNGFDNIYKQKGRYPEVEIRKMRIQGDPDLILLPNEPYEFTEEDAFELGRYSHHAKTIFVDGQMFSWYGTRVLKAFEYFKKLQNRIAT
ncbi:ABC transporter substrate-binding protein [Flavobacterium branchiophilum]|uniref:Cobalamin-binding protein n=1 Tax=Flavobacterium branchiophilum TaxID=55197 RepID=A0A2H3KDF2_9FLAO|nr:helical backbone metal receptor [Flavobacterium branchiophilum]PDS25802.1 cobalamin-binding protein [Flavobacterium branchiophilum]